MIRPSAVLISASLIGGMLVVLLGLSELQWHLALPWTGGGQVRYGLFLLLSVALVLMGSRWFRKSPMLVTGGVAALLAIVAGALWPLLVTGWFALAALVLGGSILTVLRPGACARSDWRTSFLVGAGLYATATGLLAHFPVNYPAVYGLMLAAPLVVGWRAALEYVLQLRDCMRDAVVEKGQVNALDVAISVSALVYIVVALMPEVGYDALATHLFVPAHLALNHQWEFDFTNYVWAVMPMHGDWIFSIGYMLAGETGARLLNVGFIFILGWLVRDVVLWAGPSITGARWATLLYLTMPLTFTEGSSLFIESVWASFVVAGTLLVFKVATDPQNSRFDLPVAGLMLGCALAAKAVTFTILPGLLLVLAVRYRSWLRVQNVSAIASGMVLFLVVGLIPYLHAWLQTGNPVFPFFNSVFQSQYYPIGEDFNNPRFNTGVTWDILYRITFESQKYLEATTGAPGFQWLLLFVPALVFLFAFRQYRSVALVLVGAFSIAMAFHSQSYLRYTFPAWTLITAAIGVALGAASSMRNITGIALSAAAAIVVVMNFAFLGAGSFYRDFPLRSVLDGSTRFDYLTKRLPIRNTIGVVNTLNVTKNPVAVFGEPSVAGLAADALYPNWYNKKFQAEIAAAHTAQDLANALLRRGVTYVILDRDWGGEGAVDGATTRALVEEVTGPLVEFGALSARKIKNEYRFKVELLANPEFTSLDGWVLVGESRYDAGEGTVFTSVTSPATQAVAVAPGHHYRNVVVARCPAEPTLGRVQINWVVEEGYPGGADLRTFECARDWGEHVMEVVAPPHAVGAIVYTGGHTEIPVEFTRNSLLE